MKKRGGEFLAQSFKCVLCTLSQPSPIGFYPMGSTPYPKGPNPMLNEKNIKELVAPSKRVGAPCFSHATLPSHKRLRLLGPQCSNNNTLQYALLELPMTSQVSHCVSSKCSFNFQKENKRKQKIVRSKMHSMHPHNTFAQWYQHYRQTPRENDSNYSVHSSALFEQRPKGLPPSALITENKDKQREMDLSPSSPVPNSSIPKTNPRKREQGCGPSSLVDPKVFPFPPSSPIQLVQPDQVCFGPSPVQLV